MALGPYDEDMLYRSLVCSKPNMSCSS